MKLQCPSIIKVGAAIAFHHDAEIITFDAISKTSPLRVRLSSPVAACLRPSLTEKGRRTDATSPTKISRARNTKLYLSAVWKTSRQ